jgi:hypothetical protein
MAQYGLTNHITNSKTVPSAERTECISGIQGIPGGVDKLADAGSSGAVKTATRLLKRIEAICNTIRYNTMQYDATTFITQITTIY